jgi:Neurotransmitter-gated ion-channel ligand binding domain
MSDEKRLIKYLLDNYETIGVVGRPVYNTSETVSVQYGIGLIQILDLNEKDQILTTNVWCRYVSITCFVHLLRFFVTFVFVGGLN